MAEQDNKEPSAASGKVILLGEHAVVYGAPALVASLGRGVRAKAATAQTSELHLISTLSSSPGEERATPESESDLGRAFGALLESLHVSPVAVTAHVDLPTGVGLGGSAAIAVATARAALRAQGEHPEPERVKAATQAWEKVFHGNPSGIDTEAAIGGGCLLYQKPDIADPVKLPSPMTLAICVAGPRASTLEMVRQVGERLDSDPEGTRAILDRIADFVLDGLVALEEGDQERLGQLLDANHEALQALGLSTPDLDRACELARRAGALGAKLTGSGGGGCVIALCDAADPILKTWRDAGLTCFASTFGDKGPCAETLSPGGGS